MGGGHGHGHEPPYKVPDYRIYKVEDVPQLMNIQQALAKQGLKDNWLRNEVCKYSKYRTTSYILKKTVFRGFKWGLLAALITTGVGYILPDDQWHGVEYEKGGHPPHHGHGEGGHGSKHNIFV